MKPVVLLSLQNAVKYHNMKLVCSFHISDFSIKTKECYRLCRPATLMLFCHSQDEAFIKRLIHGVLDESFGDFNRRRCDGWIRPPGDREKESIQSLFIPVESFPALRCLRKRCRNAHLTAFIAWTPVSFVIQASCRDIAWQQKWCEDVRGTKKHIDKTNSLTVECCSWWAQRSTNITVTLMPVQSMDLYAKIIACLEPVRIDERSFHGMHLKLTYEKHV